MLNADFVFADGIVGINPAVPVGVSAIAFVIDPDRFNFNTLGSEDVAIQPEVKGYD